MILALDNYFDHSSEDVLKFLFESLNSLDLSSAPHPNIIEKSLMRRGVSATHPISFEYQPQSWHYLTHIKFLNSRIPISIPLYRTSDEVGEVSVSLLIRTFGVSSMKIFHGILLKQRILFVGHNHGAHEICQIVLSAVAMVSPPIQNILPRAFPYASLSDLSFLEVRVVMSYHIMIILWI